MTGDAGPTACWSRPVGERFTELGSGPSGLGSAEAAARLARYGANSPAGQHDRMRVVRLFLDRLRSPLVLILIVAAVIAIGVHDTLDAAIILFIVLASATLSFIQEYRAGNAVERLKSRVAARTTVVRDGRDITIPADALVPGDVVRLSAGSIVPGDGVLLEARDLFVELTPHTEGRFGLTIRAGPWISPM